MLEPGKIKEGLDNNTSPYLMSCKAETGWVGQITVGTTGIHACRDQKLGR
ncbi:MAG TPA: hypothetical protein VGA92_03100 [Candidatus Nitrosotenuis sp.]